MRQLDKMSSNRPRSRSRSPSGGLRPLRGQFICNVNRLGTLVGRLVVQRQTRDAAAAAAAEAADMHRESAEAHRLAADHAEQSVVAHRLAAAQAELAAQASEEAEQRHRACSDESGNFVDFIEDRSTRC